MCEVSKVRETQGGRERERNENYRQQFTVAPNVSFHFFHFGSFRSKSKSLRFAMKPQSLKLSFQFDILVELHSALHASRGFHTICSITTHFAEPYLLPFTFAIV